MSKTPGIESEQVEPVALVVERKTIEDVTEYQFNPYSSLGNCLEIAGMMAVFGSSRYAKGFNDGTLLREFCEDYVPEPYMPMGDSRPTAERLGFPKPEWYTGQEHESDNYLHE